MRAAGGRWQHRWTCVPVLDGPAGEFTVAKGNPIVYSIGSSHPVRAVRAAGYMSFTKVHVQIVSRTTVRKDRKSNSADMAVIPGPLAGLFVNSGRSRLLAHVLPPKGGGSASVRHHRVDPATSHTTEPHGRTRRQYRRRRCVQGLLALGEAATIEGP